ncbi:hypothetical protein L596_001931 [Steinernema carpocapsae]|uniref:Uncharacterized protein n=1 Tax=Steinernema carpocapsae TaxID=34508 RepID=A0A4U8UPQ4_STECR|nr:hypothetical protein L596_001931 [Steinernema carpocapsae]
MTSLGEGHSHVSSHAAMLRPTKFLGDVCRLTSAPLHPRPGGDGADTDIPAHKPDHKMEEHARVSRA